MKRGRGGSSLTGGTGDVNPQWMTFTATQSGADTTTTTTQAIPVQRLPVGGKSQVMEVLKVFYQMPAFPAIASAAEAADIRSIFLSTVNFGTTATSLAEPRVFSGFADELRGAFTAAGTFGSYFPNVVSFDLTDGAGHGLIIATDNIFAQVVTSGTGATNAVFIKILYRWKNIGLQEYIGIVQSQQ